MAQLESGEYFLSQEQKSRHKREVEDAKREDRAIAKQARREAAFTAPEVCLGDLDRAFALSGVGLMLELVFQRLPEEGCIVFTSGEAESEHSEEVCMPIVGSSNSRACKNCHNKLCFLRLAVHACMHVPFCTESACLTDFIDMWIRKSNQQPYSLSPGLHL